MAEDPVHGGYDGAPQVFIVFWYKSYHESPKITPPNRIDTHRFEQSRSGSLNHIMQVPFAD